MDQRQGLSALDEIFLLNNIQCTKRDQLSSHTLASLSHTGIRMVCAANGRVSVLLSTKKQGACGPIAKL